MRWGRREGGEADRPAPGSGASWTDKRGGGARAHGRPAAAWSGSPAAAAHGPTDELGAGWGHLLPRVPPRTKSACPAAGRPCSRAPPPPPAPPVHGSPPPLPLKTPQEEARQLPNPSRHPPPPPAHLTQRPNDQATRRQRRGTANRGRTHKTTGQTCPAGLWPPGLSTRRRRGTPRTLHPHRRAPHRARARGARRGGHVVASSTSKLACASSVTHAPRRLFSRSSTFRSKRCVTPELVTKIGENAPTCSPVRRNACLKTPVKEVVEAGAP